MGYQLVVWEGEKPANDAAAGDVCREMMQRYYTSAGVEPTPAIREFVAALTDVWTDNSNDPRWDDSPWKLSPIIDDASGPLLFLNMRFGMGERVSFQIAEMAPERGLITFDTYVEVMRPCPKQVIDDWTSKAWDAVAEIANSLAYRRQAPWYQLVIWEGERPASDEAGLAASEDILRTYFAGEATEPTEAIRRFVHALTELWPDDPTEPGWDGSPWQAPHLLDNASGPAFLIHLPMDVEVLAGCVVAATAEEHNLVVFDPQVGLLRPVSEELDSPATPGAGRAR